MAAEGKEDTKGKIAHKTVAVKRFFLNTVGQNPMQPCIEILLGKFLNVGFSSKLAKFIKKELNAPEIKAITTKTKPVAIFVGTWNCNGTNKLD